ncbi:MAG: hypothetical protein K0R48_74 [Gammaproteobacteria bacterium]|jgi:hypothetical protein|nr:hypothetical protein [Gammaproteobacteria bacterium]
MNIANEVRALIEATKKCLGDRPCDFRLVSHQENQTLTQEEEQNAQKNNTPILIKKHDGSFSIYGKKPRAVWKEKPLKNLTEEERKALIDVDFSQSTLKFEKDLLHNKSLISALQKGHPATIYEHSLTNTFQNLLYEGIPELKEKPFYYPIYEICATEQDVPVEKKPGYIYLYIKDEQLHYQTQWIVDPGPIEQPPIFKGTIHLEARLLQEVQFVDSSVKAGDPIRTLWYLAAKDNCIYACISDNKQLEVGAISITPKCNLFLCDTLEGSASPQLMATAQQQQTPILIRRANKFSIYGGVEGVWQERTLENLSAEEQTFLSHVSFEKPILHDNEIEDNLTDILRKGHSKAGNTRHSVEEKLLIEVKKHCASKEENLKKLKQKIDRDICDASHMQPFYENPSNISNWHKEILAIETGFLNSAEELLRILNQESFRRIFVGDVIAEQLIDRLKENFAKIALNQRRIADCLREFKDPRQIIAHLKEAYGGAFDAVLYSEMTILLAKFDLLLKESYSAQIAKFLEGDKDVNSPQKLVHFLARKNLTVRFGTQYILRRSTLFTNFSEFFRKGHLQFLELASVFNAVNKSAVAANRAQDGGFEERVKNGEEDPNHSGFTDLIRMVNKEQDPYKKMNLDLIQPLVAFLVLDTQNVSEKGREKNDTAIFYLQRRILIEQLQKFKNKWTLSEEASSVADNALAMVYSSGYTLLQLELKANELTYIVCLKGDPVTEIRGSIDIKEIQGLNVPDKLDLKDTSLTANILWVIARKGHLPPPLAEDSVLLLRAVIQVIDVLSPEKCRPPENKEAARRGRLQPSLEKRPKSSSTDSPEPIQNVRRRSLSTLYSKADLFSGASSSSRSSSEIDEVQLVPSPASEEWNLPVSPSEIERNLSTSPLKVDYPSASPVEFFGNSFITPQGRAHRSSSSSLLKLGDSLPSSPTLETNSHSSSENKEEITHLRAHLFDENLWRKSINLENMKKLCDYNDFNGFFTLAKAAKEGKYGIPEDMAAAFYLMCLAESNIGTVNNQNKARANIEVLRSQIRFPSSEAECDAFFTKKFGFDPKERYLTLQTARLQRRFQGPA